MGPSWSDAWRAPGTSCLRHIVRHLDTSSSGTGQGLHRGRTPKPVPPADPLGASLQRRHAPMSFSWELGFFPVSGAGGGGELRASVAGATSSTSWAPGQGRVVTRGGFLGTVRRQSCGRTKAAGGCRAPQSEYGFGTSPRWGQAPHRLKRREGARSRGGLPQPTMRRPICQATAGYRPTACRLRHQLSL